jgi:hypothetical protein
MDKLIRWGVGLAVVVLLLAGCYPLPVELPPTETPTQTPTLTATPVWFPATATPTLLPTQERTATPEMRPLVGEPILEEAFELETAWRTFSGTIGNITFTDDHVTLAINQPGGMIYAFRETPLLTDFYAEITARVNLCRSVDEYGLMVRVSGIRLDHYRLALTCDGQAKIVRVYSNGTVWIQPPQAFPEIPVGFPAESELAVWVVGTEIRFFVNGRLLFNVTDPVIAEGALGVYVRTTGDDPISVNFSQLEVFEILNSQ